jgi:hypothetical protein
MCNVQRGGDRADLRFSGLHLNFRLPDELQGHADELPDEYELRSHGNESRTVLKPFAGLMSYIWIMRKRQEEGAVVSPWSRVNESW